MKLFITSSLSVLMFINTFSQEPELVLPLGHMGNVNNMVFSPCNRFLITSSEDRTAKIWDARRGKLLYDLQEHSDNVFSASFSNDGTKAFTISRDNTMKIWDMETGKLLSSIVSPVYLNQKTVFSPDHSMMLTWDEMSDSETGSLYLWGLKDDTWQLLFIFGGAYGYGCPFSQDGHRIMFMSNDGYLTLANTKNGEIIRKFEKLVDLDYQGYFSPDGNYFITSSYAGLIIFDTGKGKRIYSNDDPVEFSRLNHKGDAIALLSKEGSIKIMHIPDGKIMILIPPENIAAPAIHDFIFSPDDNLVVIPTYDASIKIWDIKENRIRYTLPGSYPAAFSPDGNFIAVAANASLGLWSESLDQVPRIYDARSGSLQHTLEGHSKYLSAAKISSDGNKIVSDSWDRAARLWDIRNGRLSARLSGHRLLVHAVEFSTDGKYILTSTKNETAHIWDATTGNLLYSVFGDTSITKVRYDTEFYARFSPGNHCISWYTPYDSIVKIFDISGGKLKYVLRSAAPVLSAVFSNSGNELAVVASDGTASVWDLNTGRDICSIGEVNILPPEYSETMLKPSILTPDGTIIITRSHGTEVNAWDANTGILLYTLGPSETLPENPFSSDSRMLVSMALEEMDFPGGSGSSVLVRDAKTGDIILFLNEQSCPGEVYSPDNTKIITFSTSGEINIRDIKTGTLDCNIPPDAGTALIPPSLIRFSSDGRKIITGNFDGMIRIYDVMNGKNLRTFTLGEPCFPDQHVSLNGKYFMNITTKGNLELWDLQLLKAIRKFDWKYAMDLSFNMEGMPASPNEDANDPLSLESFVFSPDGEYILLAGYDGTTTIIESNTGKVLKIFEPQNAPPESTDFFFTSKVLTGPFSPDSKTILANHNGNQRIWDLQKGEWLPEMENAEMIADYTPDGNHLYEIMDTGLKIWDVQAGKEISSIEFPITEGAQYTFSSDGSRLLTSFNNKSCLWNVNNGELLNSVTESEEITSSLAEEKIDYESGFTSLVFSPDDQQIATNSKSGIQLWNSARGNKIADIPYEIQSAGISSRPFSPDGKYLAIDINRIQTDEGNMMQNTNDYSIISSTTLIDTHTGLPGKTFEGTTIPVNGTINPPFSPDGTKILTLSDEKVFRLWDVNTGSLRCNLGWVDPERFAESALFSADGRFILTSSFRTNDMGYITKYEPLDLRNASSGELLRTIDIGSALPSDIDWNRGIIVSHKNSKISLHDLNTGKEKVSFVAVDEDDYVFILPSGYYMGSPRGVNSLSWRLGNKLYDFDQWDLQYNRPDKVLEQLGNTDSALVMMYRKAYLKRLKKSGFTEEMFSSGWHTPEAKIINAEEYNVSVADPNKKLVVSLSDSLYTLDRYNVWINDVPVAGKNGISVRHEVSGNLVKTVDLTLSAGRNKIQVSCTNEKGVESLKELVEVIYLPENEVKPDLYVIAMCVSKYEDAYYDLQYAVKDGRDIVSMFISKTGEQTDYNHIFIDTLFDVHARKEEFFTLKEKLLSTHVDDQVVLFISGHGLLNAEAEFYFATSNIDFSKPEEKGISFDDMENLLDSIPARKKLIMMDACHSGEYDKDEEAEMLAMRTGAWQHVQSRGMVKTYDFGGKKGISTHSGVNLKSSFQLMQELFSGLDKGTGTVAISAAAGRGYALESATWNNGVFTYSIINGLRNMAADKNKDNRVTISELKEYSITEVEQLTKGNQKPTARREVAGADWWIW